MLSNRPCPRPIGAPRGPAARRLAASPPARRLAPLSALRLAASPPARRLASLSALLLAAAVAPAACSPQPASPEDADRAAIPPPAEGGPAAPAAPPGAEPGTPRPILAGRANGDACRLPAPVRSDDACSTDADCGPSSPCHAKACVAAAKAQPPTPSTVCTQSLECDSIDANRCGCLEGRCALIPAADDGGSPGEPPPNPRSPGDR